MSVSESLEIPQHFVPRMFRISVQRSIEAILPFAWLADDDTESTCRPGLIATTHLARVGMNVSEIPPGKGGRAHTLFHEVGDSRTKNSAIAAGMY